MITQEQADKVRSIVSGFDDEKKKMFLEKYGSLDADKKQIVISRLLQSEPSKPIIYSDQEYMAGVRKRGQEAQSSIASRGNIGDALNKAGQDISSPNWLKKGLGVLEGAQVPVTMLKAGISNPALAMQQGNFNPGNLINESYKGFTGQKLGSYSDVVNTAVPAFAGKVAGLATDLTLDIAGPIKVMKTINKALGSVSMMSDASLMKAGGDLTKALEASQTHVGTKLGEAFDSVNKISANQNDVNRLMRLAPKELQKAIVEEFGKNMKPTVENLRKLKQFVGKYNPSSFGREERGLTENIKGDKVNNMYGAIKSVITNTIARASSVKKAEQLMDLEESASKVYKASDMLNKVTTNPTLLLKTKAGKLAEGMTEASDVSSREALNIIKKNGPEARKYVNKVVSALENFNRTQRNIRIIKHIASAATYGGAIGAAGSAGLSLIGRKISGVENS